MAVLASRAGRLEVRYACQGRVLVRAPEYRLAVSCRYPGRLSGEATGALFFACALRAIARLATRSQTLSKQICTLHGM